LKAVRANLPKEGQDDIIRELAENLRSQMEDREAQLGRPLSSSEQEAMLKAHGHPLAVASRYRDDRRSLAFGRQWIGPELFPIYAKILTINAVVTVTIFVAALILSAAGLPLRPIVSNVALTVVLQFGIITGIFAMLQARLDKNPDRWDPITGAPSGSGGGPRATGLDALALHLIGKSYLRVPRLLSAFELALGVIGLLWWLAVPRFVQAIFRPAAIGFMRTGPGWDAFYVPFLILVAASLVQPLSNLIRPAWVRYRSFSRAAIGVLFAILLFLSFRAGNWIVAADPSVASADHLALIRGINQWIGRIGLLVVGCIAVTVVLELRRAFRSGSATPRGIEHASNGGSVAASS